MCRDYDYHKEQDKCNECKSFCKKRRDDFDSIDDIRQGLKNIMEGLRDIEKNHICEGIKDIEESMKHTEEGLQDICGTLKKAFRF